jgi:hypothetical protein
MQTYEIEVSREVQCGHLACQVTHFRYFLGDNNGTLAFETEFTEKRWDALDPVVGPLRQHPVRPVRDVQIFHPVLLRARS